MLIRRTVTPKRVLVENILLDPVVLFKLEFSLLLSPSQSAFYYPGQTGWCHFLTLINNTYTYSWTGEYALTQHTKECTHSAVFSLQSVNSVKKKYFSLKLKLLKSCRDTMKELTDELTDSSPFDFHIPFKKDMMV